MRITRLKSAEIQMSRKALHPQYLNLATYDRPMGDLRKKFFLRAFRQAFDLFTKRQQKKLVFLAIVQILLGFIDFVAVALLAILGKLAITGVQSRPSTGIV